MPAALTIVPLDRAPDCSWTVPGSKSITNRALVLAALSPGETLLTGALLSDDTRHMAGALRALGIGVEISAPDRILVDGGRDRLRQPAEPLFIGNSGTSVRFLAALACLVPGTVELVGDAHMQRRPIADLVTALRSLGVRVDCPSGCPPLRIHGGSLPGGRVAIPGTRSSQYFSALLLAGCAADAPLEIEILGELVSRPYVAMTAAMIRDWGGQATLADDRLLVTPAIPRRERYAIEPDATAASYPLAAALVTKGRIRVPGLDAAALQGDVAFAPVLARTGATLTADDQGLMLDARDCPRPQGIEVDMHHISDTVMTLAAIAPLLAGPTTIRNVANIRIKETDRLQATVNELERLGQQVEHGADWLRIEPRPLRPATIDCYADHRMAMSFAIPGLACAGIAIADPDCVAKTYPGFWADLRRLYAAVGQEAPW